MTGLRGQRAARFRPGREPPSSAAPCHDRLIPPLPCPPRAAPIPPGNLDSRSRLRGALVRCALAKPLRQIGDDVMRTLRTQARQRRGTAVVETAVVLPVYLLLLLGIVEFGHAQLVRQPAEQRVPQRGARRLDRGHDERRRRWRACSRRVGTAVPVEQDHGLRARTPACSTARGTPPTTDAGLEALPDVEVADAEPRQMFVVRAKVAYNDIALVPMPFLKNVTLDAQAFMRHE